MIRLILLAVVAWGFWGVALGRAQETGNQPDRPSLWSPLIVTALASGSTLIVWSLVRPPQRRKRSLWDTRGLVTGLLAGMAAASSVGLILWAFQFNGWSLAIMPAVFGVALASATIGNVVRYRNEAIVSWPLLALSLIVILVGCTGVSLFPARLPGTVLDVQFATRTGLAWIAGLFVGAIGPCTARAVEPDRASSPSLIAGWVAAMVFLGAIVPLSILFLRNDLSFDGSIGSTGWSVLAGVSLALGWIGLYSALLQGARWRTISPWLFGLCPVINTLFAQASTGWATRLGTSFQISLLLIIVGSIVLARTMDLSQDVQ